MAADRPWKLCVGGKVVERARTLKALQSRRSAGWWIRHRRGRRIEAWHESTGEGWKWEPRGGWFKIREAARHEGRETPAET